MQPNEKPHKSKPGEQSDRQVNSLRSSLNPLYESQVNSLNSSNSLIRSGVDDFPEPLSDVAFHGLAGDIVRRIEPHTEADPAALLIQTVIAYGNVIGHSAHTVADGSRHSTNLFAVIVGESAKSRKGTSLQHVLGIVGRADDGWQNNNITHGLSSGEGLTWEVRDAITNGDELIDAGVSDKRLTVIEAEFANVLKVMARQGSTLSPVIRTAWDSGNLRVMTKNSPARATGAHVSIIGHITRDELRRYLTETESANGFGNRFLFVAVRRSKVLPEGGNIEGENLNDLVSRLHEAIEFARNADRVTRDDTARKLWAIAYPELSEGKPGLLGAITARAEAQVLRLSCIYALIDCSTKIKPEHHRAALALWNYCERSAKWIFSTATGDPYADRILFALKKAASKGLTRTDIYNDVLQGNVRRDALDDALRVLLRNKLAVCQKESTHGKPCERWFHATN
jgi:Protein of unknown function (DUF3987)